MTISIMTGFPSLTTTSPLCPVDISTFVDGINPSANPLKDISAHGRDVRCAYAVDVN